MQVRNFLVKSQKVPFGFSHFNECKRVSVQESDCFNENVIAVQNCES